MNQETFLTLNSKLLKVAVGDNLRLLRHRKGWSQQDVAEQLGISIPAYSKIEAGITDMNLSRVEQIAHVYGLSAVQLLALQEKNHILQEDEIELINEKLVARETEPIVLQRKVIFLYEELRNTAHR